MFPLQSLTLNTKSARTASGAPIPFRKFAARLMATIPVAESTTNHSGHPTESPPLWTKEGVAVGVGAGCAVSLCPIHTTCSCPSGSFLRRPSQPILPRASPPHFAAKRISIHWASSLTAAFWSCFGCLSAEFPLFPRTLRAEHGTPFCFTMWCYR